jgi:N-acyl homoserine lactone hydrolase
VSTDWSIWVVEYGAASTYPLSRLLYNADSEQFRKMTYCFGLLRDDTHTILVDCGFGDTYNLDRLRDKYGSSTWEHPARMLERLGVDPAAVDHVILTHHHFDHSGALDAFPEATVVVQEREIAQLEVAMSLPPRFQALRAAASASFPHEVEKRIADGRATLVDGAAEVLPGVSVHPAWDTHTPGSQYVSVTNPEGSWVFAGDNVMVWDNLTGQQHDGVFVPIPHLVGSHWNTLMLFEEMLEAVGGDPRRVLPFHDANMWEQYPSREFADGLHVAEISLGGGHASVL